MAPLGAQTRILLYKAIPDVPGAASYEEAQARIGKPTGMVLEVDDIEATFAQLKANVVPIEEQPHKQPWGWWEVFADQDSNTFIANDPDAVIIFLCDIMVLSYGAGSSMIANHLNIE